MADLDTITLSELDTVSELLETDTLLVERGGRIKRFTGEVGGGNNTLIITDTNGTLNKTFNQIKNAIDVGTIVLVAPSNNSSAVGTMEFCYGYTFQVSEGHYAIHIINSGSFYSYIANSQTDYPVVST